ncbi:MAG: putative ABC transporter permease [Eubacterium sp.]|nr:putative ABC transporter permease [Eubacterium sp.]
MAKGNFKRRYKNYINSDISFDKKTWVAIVLLLFVSMAVLGFIVEINFYHINSIIRDGKDMWFWRGSAFGPWIDIYGIGAVAAFALTYKFRKKPWLVLIISGVVLSLMELIAGMAIYYLDNGRREWNYNEEIWTLGNIGGFICGRNIIAFSLAGPFVVYLVVPAIMRLAKKMNRKVFLGIAYVLGAICIGDIFYNDIIHTLFPQCPKASHFYKQYGFKFVKFTQHDKAFWKLK